MAIDLLEAITSVPTLELHGFSPARSRRLVALAHEALASLPYHDDIVFVLGIPSRVEAWDGGEKPFVRVLTRRRSRAQSITARLLPHTDVETVIIGFFPRQPAQEATRRRRPSRPRPRRR